MNNVDEITPQELIDAFTEDPYEYDWEKKQDAYDRYLSIQDKSRFLEPIVNFVKEAPAEPEDDQADDRADEIRCWGTAALGWMMGNEAEKAKKFLNELLKESDQKTVRRFCWTRFNTLYSLDSLTQSLEEKKELLRFLPTIAFNNDEDYLNQAAACALIVHLSHETGKRTERARALKRIKGMLSPTKFTAGNVDFKGYTAKGSLAESYWPALRALHALKEFPLGEFGNDIIEIIRDSPYYEHKSYAIQVLGGYWDETVVYELGSIARRNKDSNLRLRAVISLGQIKDPRATGDLLKALVDKNAEIRVEASDALESTLGKPDALKLIVQEAMRETAFRPDAQRCLVDALRRIDENKQFCGEILERELDSSDLNCAQRAQEILYEMGGVEALKRLNRSKTLEATYTLLEDAEKRLQNAFQSTTLQATRNFYFSMIINAVIVGVGIALIGLAISQVLAKPENLAGWITPGAGGVFGIILTLYLNGPRKNAQQDLRVLMNANVIYYGFLRMLNIIDATFKHDFVEDPSFGAKNMTETVSKIDTSLKTVLNLTATHLFLEEERDNGQGSTPKSENEKPEGQTPVAPLENQ